MLYIYVCLPKTASSLRQQMLLPAVLPAIFLGTPAEGPLLPAADPARDSRPCTRAECSAHKCESTNRFVCTAGKAEGRCSSRLWSTSACSEYCDSATCISSKAEQLRSDSSMKEERRERAPCPDSSVGPVELKENLCKHESPCKTGHYQCVNGTVSGLDKGSCDVHPWRKVALEDCNKWCLNEKTSVSPGTNLPRTLVLSVASDGSRELVARNIRSQPELDFGIVLHSGEAAAWHLLYRVANITGNRFFVRQGRMPAGVDPSNHGFIPKLWFQSQVTDWVKRYDYVWMVDEDMSFAANFDYNEFWRRHQHDFPDGPPIVAQPTIRQNGQFYALLNNANTYPCEVRAAVNTYIEQQVPLFDAKFWAWLVPRLDALKRKQVELENDWVTDHVWCLAAADYNSSRTGCAVITTPIDTLDSDTSGWRKNENSFDSFLAAGLALADWACSEAQNETTKDRLDMQWAKYANDDRQNWPPKATMLIPPMPKGSSEGSLPWPFWNEAEKDNLWWNETNCSVAKAARARSLYASGRRQVRLEELAPAAAA